MRHRSSSPAPWPRRRLVALLVAVVVVVVALVAGLGYTVTTIVTPGPAAPARDDNPRPHAGGPPESVRDAIADAPMLQVSAEDARSGTPAADTGPVMAAPAATRVGAAGVPSGFPHTPEGAVAQLAAIETTVLQAMSMPLIRQVYQDWALPGGVGTSRWELTVDVQTFLAAAQTGPDTDPTLTVVAISAAGQVKGADGPDWTLACVLLDVRAVGLAEARMGYGHCERMQWQDGRWLLAPGRPASPAPSVWPGTDLAARAGWRRWTEPVER